ncbi:hypothetical protein VOLCADRAFT_89869 [Volvox carteri f. nagariensis]|uniref:Amidohydrolase-related domain-containing protein n=1 Tax=Volvox carteri f. nagariensis TaxID=3068 RepID=D8TSV8_VOLCA|nr:uncharacterized protein VOLCADRAFT_89869 [Volvox carteri f. nagariensis]EFJ49445.1 hypothetical protein VOLCADRAFT_89869 [Volvox carteri f. nagariensis]|eukprot:XP_002949426.1 hypothetical protein VOLCADRAFT_89869 [Volvox carteri f. nagariensis]
MSFPRAGVPRAPPNHTLFIRDISYLATQNDALGEITQAGIFIRGNVIEWVGKMSDLPPELAESADNVIDGKGHVFLPGLVNTHAHMFQALNRCMAQPPAQRDDGPAASRLAQDAVPGVGSTHGRLDDTIRAARVLGLRFHPVRGGMSAGVSRGGIAPDSVVELETDILDDMRRCIREFHDNSRLSMLRVSLGPASQKTVTNELMLSAARLAREHPGVRLHTHLAENQEDIEYTERLYGYRFGPYISTVEWDKCDCWFAHCVKIFCSPLHLTVRFQSYTSYDAQPTETHARTQKLFPRPTYNQPTNRNNYQLNESERALFAERGIGVAHCPSSNTRLASGIAPVRAMLDAGVNVGLGVDGACSSDAQSLLAEARLAVLLQRAGGDPRGLGVREALRMATRGGAANLGRQQEVGQLAPGFAADVVGFKVAGKLAFAGTVADPVAALLLCAPDAGPVNWSIIDGHVVVREGVLLAADGNLWVRHEAAAAVTGTAAVSDDNVGEGVNNFVRLRPRWKT